MSTLSNIIVTEDDEGLNHLMQKILRREGFKTEGALSGKDAIKKATSNQDSLMLLDYGLPDMTGKEVIQALSRRKDNVPFMLVTGKGNEHVAVDMMKRGAMDYIIKDDGFIKELPVKVRSVLAALDWKKDVEEAEETLQKKYYLNQMMIERMPYLAIIINPMTNEIISSNAVAEKAGIVSGRKCASFASDSVTPCPWCNPPAMMASGEEHQTIFEVSGKLWDATWMAIDDNMYMVFASDISDRKETYLDISSKKAELRDLSEMSDGIDQNLNSLKNNMKSLANNLLQMKDKSDK
jgi:FixJ family two-component response regulator